MTEKAWCSHMDQSSSVAYSSVENGHIKKYSLPQWLFCPICGTPRPAPKKTMADELRDYFNSTIDNFWPAEERPLGASGMAYYKADWEGLASRAKELILDGKEEGIFKVLQESLKWKIITDSDRRFITGKILTYLRESC